MCDLQLVDTGLELQCVYNEQKVLDVMTIETLRFNAKMLSKAERNGQAGSLAAEHLNSSCGSRR